MGVAGTKARGGQIPKHCREPRLLQYREMGKLGGRLEILRSIIPPDQLMVIVFDDLTANTKRIYEQVLEFIGVPSDNRQTFPAINENKVQRSRVRLLGRLLISSMPTSLYRAVLDFKKIGGYIEYPT